LPREKEALNNRSIAFFIVFSGKSGVIIVAEKEFEMDEVKILVTLAGGFAVALIFGYLAHRLKLSPIIGYLLAGIVIGPYTPGFVADRASAEHFAEIGVILLLFGVGLRFNLRELFAVWRLAVPGALIQSSVSTSVLALILKLMGWDWISGIILGMAISVASTVVMVLVLAEWHDLHAKIGHIAIGWTVVEDLLTVAMLLLLPIIFAPDKSIAPSFGLVLGLTAIKVMGLLVIVVILGKWVIPLALERIAMTRSHELFTLAVLVLAIGIAVLSAKIFGVSMALGAFLAGLAVGRSEFAARAANDALPMRDAFAVLFFVSIGMLFDPKSLLAVPQVIGIVLLVVIVVKPLAAALTVRVLGQPLATAVPVGAAFSQVGEFSFILGTVALGLGLINDAGWSALVAASIISIALNPYIYRFARRWSSKSGGQEIPVIAGQKPVVNPSRCILIGYGPVGKIVFRLLAERGVEITVIDLNLETVRHLRQSGLHALYGDVLRPGTLVEAGIANAGALIISADIEDAAEIVRQARRLNPEINIIVRCAYLRDAQKLRNAGANVVAAGEAEVGVALAEVVTAGDQLACEISAGHRETIRRTLYDAP
jgi:monovalent cation:H+ antiporter-2, CPA2 family